MLQNILDNDVLQDNDKLSIVEDIEVNGLNTSIDQILKWQKMP